MTRTVQISGSFVTPYNEVSGYEGTCEGTNIFDFTQDDICLNFTTPLETGNPIMSFLKHQQGLVLPISLGGAATVHVTFLFLDLNNSLG